MAGEVFPAGYQDLPILEQARGLVDAGVFREPVVVHVLDVGLYSSAEVLLRPLSRDFDHWFLVASAGRTSVKYRSR